MASNSGSSPFRRITRHTAASEQISLAGPYEKPRRSRAQSTMASVSHRIVSPVHLPAISENTDLSPSLSSSESSSTPSNNTDTSASSLDSLPDLISITDSSFDSDSDDSNSFANIVQALQSTPPQSPSSYYSEPFFSPRTPRQPRPHFHSLPPDFDNIVLQDDIFNDIPFVLPSFSPIEIIMPSSPVLSSSVLKHAPDMLAGEPTAESIVEWEHRAWKFFRVGSISAKNQVLSILGCFHQNAKVFDWISGNISTWEADIALDHTKFSFEKFMKEMQKAFLPNNWMDIIIKDKVCSRMGETESFSDYSTRVIAGNTLLTGSDAKKSEEMLREIMTMNCSESLRMILHGLLESERERLRAIKNLHEWMRNIQAIDVSVTSQAAHVFDRASAQLQEFMTQFEECLAKHPRTNAYSSSINH
ncbi:hypothetical protein BDN70DRAFT_977426 [Pholiota conissans]|uniref:Retrotransposon gag domain-containing protein n=1 Tax=Pholiota conissans TaxID=109636 RepID=A0A9P5YK32_9AGAR|nr:hypothetical protein BDN70DRAFT_977426 [Pholiota conissans]